MKKQTSQQILPTAANLIGFCLFVITSMHVSDKAAISVVDGFVSIITLMLTLSCLFSFMAIKSVVEKRTIIYEKIAEISFVGSLLGLLIIILLLVDGVIK